MKKMKLLKKLLLAILIISLFTGCSKADQNVDATGDSAGDKVTENTTNTNDTDTTENNESTNQEVAPGYDQADSTSSESMETTLTSDESQIDYSKPITGVYQGLADNNSIEVLAGNTYLSVYADDISQYLTGIEAGDTVEIKVEVSPSDQLLLKEIVKVD